MAPTNPWTTQQPKQPLEASKSKSGFPELHRDYGGAKTQYEEAQDHELIALEAIYGPDFETVPVPGAGAWKVSSRLSICDSILDLYHSFTLLSLFNKIT
jgi:hypothetical protein